jgi:ribosomal protein S18 acetylase RimI-like enzyme
MSEHGVHRPVIRRAALQDADALALVGAATFLETYAEIVSGRDMIMHVASKHAPALYALWAEDPSVRIWIAETHTRAPAGFLVLIPATLPVEGPEAGDLEVLRIYVLDRYHGTGLGHALIRVAIEEARARKAPRLVIGLHGENKKALAFYRREGFDVIGRRTFIVGDAVCDDLVVALSLRGE